MRRGHAAAFDVIYERHAQAALSLACRMAGSLLVTDEPAGGSDVPTKPPVITAASA